MSLPAVSTRASMSSALRLHFRRIRTSLEHSKEQRTTVTSSYRRTGGNHRSSRAGESHARLGREHRVAEIVVHKENGRPIKQFRKTWAAVRKNAGVSWLRFHDFERSAVPNLARSGGTQAVAMKITGHKTASVYRRYRIVSEQDMLEALDLVQQGNEQRENTRRVVPVSESKEASR